MAIALVLLPSVYAAWLVWLNCRELIRASRKRQLPDTGAPQGMSEIGMTDLLSSSEVSQLARAFSEISDPVARRAIMGMVKQFADSKTN